jgi:hypothetical protein
MDLVSATSRFNWFPTRWFRRQADCFNFDNLLYIDAVNRFADSSQPFKQALTT